MIIDMNNPILYSYRNGNYDVKIYKDGTKIRSTLDNSFKPEFPESIDMNITYKCDGNCPYCYLGCNEKGEYANFNTYKKLFDSLHFGTEIAINGNDLSHPYLMSFLEDMKKRSIIVNMTVNQIHFMKNIDLLKDLTSKELIHGLGISLRSPDDEFIEKVKEFDNAVIHIINGIVTKDDLDKLSDKDLKILILGYKNILKGAKYMLSYAFELSKNMDYLYDNIGNYIYKFKVISFDNLALIQLDIEYRFSDIFAAKDNTDSLSYDKFFMGDDGEYTMYIDLVKGLYGKSSMDNSYDMKKIKSDDTILSIFKNIKK